jgi:hypothetical protein
VYSFPVRPKGQTITLSAAPVGAVFGGRYAPSASASSGLATSLAVVSGPCKISAGVVTFYTGTCTVQANQDGNADWAAAAAVSHTFVVGQVSQTVSFSSSPSPAMSSVGIVFQLSGSSSSGLPVSFSSNTPATCTVSGSYATLQVRKHLKQRLFILIFCCCFKAVGTCTIVVSSSGNTDYAPASALQSFAVSQGTQIITWGAAPAVANVLGT